MTLNANLLFCRQRYVYCDQMAEARIMWFSLKVALYLDHLYIKFDNEI